MLTLKAKRFHTTGNTQLHFTGQKGRSAVIVLPDEEAEQLEEGVRYGLAFMRKPDEPAIDLEDLPEAPAEDPE